MTERGAYIGIGSNIEPLRHIPSALRALRERFGALACSPAYRSPPLGFEGADFINCVVRIDTGLAPDKLVACLKGLESDAGRRLLGTHRSRELDLDLLLYGGLVLRDGALRLPRSDVLDYAFVLRPFAELAPDLVHPLTGRSLAWHWAHFEGDAVALAPVTVDGTTGL